MIAVNNGEFARAKARGMATTLARHRRTDSARVLDARATRTVDIVVSLAALALVAPLMVVLMVLMKLTDPGPVFFAQPRIGRHGRTFRCLKFRSMVVDAEQQLARYLAAHPEAREEWDRDHKLRNDPRITWIGRFLRKSSLDELPQLINILRGDMALVGPRPIVPAEAIRYGRYLAAYASVRPGLTGLWQISGRNNTTYRRRVAIDTCYARSRSLSFDIKILAKTVPAVLLASGSY